MLCKDGEITNGSMRGADIENSIYRLSVTKN